MDDHGNTLASATRLPFGTQLPGAIEVGADFDVFAVDLVAGHFITVEAVRTAQVSAGGLVDPIVALYDNTGKVVASDDEAYGNSNARLNFSVPASGTYFIAVFNYDAVGTGAYYVGVYRKNIVNGSSFNDIISGTGAPDAMLMGKGNDSFNGGSAGDDLLDGGEGIDSVTYTGAASRYVLEHVPTDGWSTSAYGWVVSDKQLTDGNDTLIGVERLRFADTKWALDLDGAAGITAKILGAVFGKESIANREYVGIGLAQLDGGTTLDALRQLALTAKLGANPSPAEVVTLLYTNVAGVAPSAAELSLYTGLLANGTYTPAGLVGLASDHPQNLLNIGFSSLVDHGIGYT